MSTIAAGIITYPIKPERVEYLGMLLDSFQKNVTSSLHELKPFVSCEWDRRGDVTAARRLCVKKDVPFHVHDGDPCMGSNQNNTMRIAFDVYKADYLLSLIDDFIVPAPLDLSPEIDYLDAHPKVDVLRYHWCTRTNGACPTFHDRGDGYNQVDPASNRFYDDSPHIRRANFVERFGRHIELTPAEAGKVERVTCRTLREQGANIVATKELRFGKGGAVSACH